MRKRILIIFIVIMLFVIGIKVFDIYSRVLKMFYPEGYSEYVDKYAELYGVDRKWIFALIKTESNFRQDSISQSGAIGLMQLMEKTAIEVAKEIRNNRFKFR